MNQVLAWARAHLQQRTSIIGMSIIVAVCVGYGTRQITYGTAVTLLSGGLTMLVAPERAPASLTVGSAAAVTVQAQEPPKNAAGVPVLFAYETPKDHP